MTASSAPQYSLVLGGTGMLAEATNWLAGRSEKIVLASRSATQFSSNSPKFVALDLDWATPEFRSGITQALKATPTITHALLWLHDPEPTLAWLLPLLSQAIIVVVLGCLDGDPDVLAVDGSIATVRLGSKADKPNGRRWLTNKEISDGAILALTTRRSQVIGDLRPA